MFLTSPLAHQFTELLEREDFQAIAKLYSTNPREPAANWFFIKSMLMQTKPHSAFKHLKTILPEMEPADRLLFQLQLDFLEFYNGRFSGDIQLVLENFVKHAQQTDREPATSACIWGFAGSLLEFGITLGKYPATMITRAVEYHAKSAWDERSFFRSMLKQTETEIQAPLLIKPDGGKLAGHVAQATAKGWYIVAGELCLCQAEMLFRSGDEEAETLFNKAGYLFQKGKHLTWEAKVNQFKGKLLLEYGRQEGLDLLAKAKMLYRAAGHWHKIKIITESEVGWYTKTVDRERLRVLNEELAEVHMHIQMPAAAGSAKMAKLKIALDHDDMDSIIGIAESISPDDDWLVQNIFQIAANAIGAGGRLDKAIELCQRSVDAFLPAHPHPSLAHAYGFLADQYAKCGDFAEAFKNLDLAYEGYESLNELGGMAVIVRRKLEYLIQEAVNKGTPLDVEQAFVDLIDLTLNRLAADSTQLNRQLSGAIYQTLGQAYTLLAQYENATACFETAEHCFLENNLISDAAALWPQLTLHLISVARLGKSVERYEEALAYAEKALQYTPPGLLQIVYRLNFHKGICLYESGRLLSGDEGESRFMLADEAFDMAAQNNEQMFRQLDNSSVSSRQQASAYFIKDKQTLYEQAFILNYHYRHDYTRALHWVQLQKMQAVLSELANSQKAIPMSERVNYREFSRKLLEKEQSLQGQRIVVFEYYCIQQNIYVFTIRSDWDGPAAERIPLSVNTVRERQNAFIADNRIARAVAGGTMSLWWQEIRPVIQTVSLWSSPGDLVYMMPHGVLHNLPLQTLFADDKITLAERNPVMWASSSYILYQLWNRRNDDNLSCKLPVILGDPANNLPWARKEASEIGNIFGVEPLLGNQASKAVFLERIACCSILHFCGHGHFIQQKGLDSYLELAEGGRLTPGDMMEKAVNSRTMAVLSGCETGLNQSLEGDEMMGLTRGFLLAGIDTLLVSLWKVGDEPTLRFFRLFYNHLFSSGDKSQALFKTIRDLKKENYNFYVWGAFVMIGNF